ncbi:hypothetical protein T484DRAFT_1819760, partial [Baffinella frigidus]
MQVAERPYSEEQGHNTILVAPQALEDLGFTGVGVLKLNGLPYTARAHAEVPVGCVALDSMQCNSVDAFIGETVEVLPQVISAYGASAEPPKICSLTLEATTLPPFFTKEAVQLSPLDLEQEHEILLVVADLRIKAQASDACAQPSYDPTLVMKVSVFFDEGGDALPLVTHVSVFFDEGGDAIDESARPSPGILSSIFDAPGILSSMSTVTCKMVEPSALLVPESPREQEPVPSSLSPWREEPLPSSLSPRREEPLPSSLSPRRQVFSPRNSENFDPGQFIEDKGNTEVLAQKILEIRRTISSQ